MMDREIQQLVEMGATAAQARAALRQYKDVMQAAERIFDGAFDDVVDEPENMQRNTAKVEATRKARMITPDEDEEDDLEDVEDDDGDEYMDYDSDFEEQRDKGKGTSTADPYAGIFFSKDRREEVIEVEEEPEGATIQNEQVKLMTQGQWMKGCPEGGEQSFLFSLYRELSEGECKCPHGCGTAIARSKRDFFPLFERFSTYTAHLKKIVPRVCKGCDKPFCFACGESTSSHAASTDKNESLFHCANLQGVILGVGLAMLEQKFLDEAQATPLDQNQKAKRRKVSADSTPGSNNDTEDDDDGYPFHFGMVVHGHTGNKAKAGTGYAGNQKEDMSGQLEAQAMQSAKDKDLSELLSRIRLFLPSVHREGGGKASDYLPHPTTLAHLRRRFNFVSSQLLRNDSLVDMSDRSVLYFELFDWLETISCHEALASMMAMPIMVVNSVKTVTHKKSSGGSIRERTIIYEGSSGPRELLEAIVIQAQAALKGLDPINLGEKTEEDEMTEAQKRLTNNEKGKGKAVDTAVADENKKLLEFCKRILTTAKAIDRSLAETKGEAFVERLHASLPKIPGTATTASNELGAELLVDVEGPEADIKQAYVDWANRIRFEYCDLTLPAESSADGQDPVQDQTPHYKFYYNSEARMLANSDIPKRSLAIAKEACARGWQLAVLTTNLPVAWDSSIFLRVDETRVDVIKALITGPEGTPYHNGVYLFDIFLGPSYNNSPPQVKYMTTAGGKYRFNPNLYADGKVCLSLLGTWQGPGWISGKSTLLQVLISIQSMILCDEPYLNEPGWATMGGSPQSKAYSANVRRMVVRTAVSASSSKAEILADLYDGRCWETSGIHQNRSGTSFALTSDLRAAR
ncbi:hypothetical protein NM688_g1784 [Phlebia brevispora]|uniref:Uncharacterized protein n=1 Tax=Phlebia brevispora TaxID=194682 RepID=A0ACC1TAB6_9APHY|nr:hypothetical protein NM688_g1784 [Phlebia brevispora]